jgi:hypothetical protein
LSEYWLLRNTWRFLHHHGRWLVEAGSISSPVREQLPSRLAALSSLLHRAFALASG